MHCIQKSAINKPTFFNKTTAGLVCVLGISTLAITVIGLTGSADSSHAIWRLGSDINHTILDVSIAILILDLFWIAKLYRKSHIQNVVPNNAKKLNPISLHNNLCHDTSKVILSYLSPNDLARSSIINKHWHTLASASITDSSPQMKRWIRNKDLKSFTAHIAKNKGNLQFDDYVVDAALTKAEACCFCRNRNYLAALIPHMQEEHLKVSGPKILRKYAVKGDYHSATMLINQAKTHHALKYILGYRDGSTSLLDLAVTHNNSKLVNFYLEKGKGYFTKEDIAQAVRNIIPYPFRYTGNIRAALKKASDEIERSTPRQHAQ